jgi:hypothetical protein
MSNSSIYKDDNGKYAKLDNCPVCGKKVHFEDDDINTVAWSFAGAFAGGEMMHDACATKEFPTEGGEYWNGTEMVYLERA